MYGLTEAAIAAGKRIKLQPAVKDGKPISYWIELVYNFRLYSTLHVNGPSFVDLRVLRMVTSFHRDFSLAQAFTPG